jgi:hypothetical protein
MDAVTSFELEAQRRRETVAIDRGDDRQRPEPVATDSLPASIQAAARSPRMTQRLASAGDCQPARATR